MTTLRCLENMSRGNRLRYGWRCGLFSRTPRSSLLLPLATYYPPKNKNHVILGLTLNPVCEGLRSLAIVIPPYGLDQPGFPSARPLAPEPFPLPRLPHNPRTECGHCAGGATQTQDRAFTAGQHGPKLVSSEGRAAKAATHPVVQARRLAGLQVSPAAKAAKPVRARDLEKSLV